MKRHLLLAMLALLLLSCFTASSAFAVTSDDPNLPPEGHAAINSDETLLLPENGLSLIEMPAGWSFPKINLSFLTHLTQTEKSMARGTYFGISLRQWEIYSLAVDNSNGECYAIVLQIGDTTYEERAKFRGYNAPENEYFKSFVSAWDPFGVGAGWVYVGHLRYFRIANISSFVGGYFESSATCQYYPNNIIKIYQRID